MFYPTPGISFVRDIDDFYSGPVRKFHGLYAVCVSRIPNLYVHGDVPKNLSTALRLFIFHPGIFLPQSHFGPLDCVSLAKTLRHTSQTVC